MKRLILSAIAALVFSGAAHAAPTHPGTTPPVCKSIGLLAEAIAIDRDAGHAQTDMMRDALEADVPLNVQRLTISMIETIYNDAAFVRQPPKQIGGMFLLACVAKLGPQRPL